MKRFKLLSYSVTQLLVFIWLLFFTSGIAFAQMGYENIYADYSKFYSHFAPQGKHTDTENYKNMPIKNRHAACADCHDPHSATRSPSPLGSYFGAGTQANVSGVRPFYAGVAAGETPKFVFLSSVVKEYELCFKCHSSYSWGTQNPPKFNWTKGRYWQEGDLGTDIVVQETDTAKEFNPNNASYFPVVARGKTSGSYTPSWAGGKTYNETFTPGWSADSFVKCSDCHRSDAGTVDPNTGVKTYDIKGPHGSTNKYILGRRSPTEEPRQNWFVRQPGAGYSQSGPKWYLRTEDNMCYDCHSIKFYGPGKGHPSSGAHATACLAGHNPNPLDYVGCAECKVMPPHGSPAERYMMKEPAGSWCNNCHGVYTAHAAASGRWVSCPRFYSLDEKGVEVEERRVHFQSARRKDKNEFFIPLPTPDMPNLKSLGTEAEYRYETREDDYIFFKEGKPAEENGYYKVKFDQPSIGDRPDGELTGEIGYEDQISLWAVDHEPDSQVYLTSDGEVIAVKDVAKPKKAVDDKGNNIMSMISERTPKEEQKEGWFTGTIGYGNTIEEIYSRGNYFILDFGDLSRARTIKLLWRVNEIKGGKLPIYIQTQDEKGRWVTRGSARHAEDRYGAMDLSYAFPKGTKSYKIKVIPTLNFVDWMAVATSLESVKVTKLSLSKADYYEYSVDNNIAPKEVKDILNQRDGSYLKFDYTDTAFLYFPIPAKDNVLTKRDFVFAPVGYFETGGPPHPKYQPEPMTAEKAQDFATVTPLGDYANHYKIELVDPDEWNRRHGLQ